MKKRIVIFLLLSALITLNVSAGLMMDDSKVQFQGIEQIKENSSRIILLNFSNYTDNEVHENVDNQTNNRTDSNTSISDSNSYNAQDNTSHMERTDTITIYGYPSSYRDTLPYRLYKTTWKASVLDICELNPKGVAEKELTRYKDDCDFSVVSGYEKDSHGLSIREYLISVEVA